MKRDELPSRSPNPNLESLKAKFYELTLEQTASYTLINNRETILTSYITENENKNIISVMKYYQDMTHEMHLENGS